MLRNLADGGKTILLVTHATANITECDQVAFLSQGRLVYYGPPAKQVSSFKLGMITLQRSIQRLPLLSRSRQKPRQLLGNHVSSPLLFTNNTSLADLKPCQYHQGNEWRVGSRVWNAARVHPVRQFLLLTKRYFDLFTCDRILLAILAAIMPLLALLVIMVAEPKWLVGDSAAVIEQQLRPAIGERSASYWVAHNGQALLFIMSLASVLLGLFSSAYEIVKERSVYGRERMIFLGILPYLGSKVVLLASFAAVQSFPFLFMIGIKLEFPIQGVFLPAVLEIYITIFLGAVAAIMLGLFLSSIAPNASAVV